LSVTGKGAVAASNTDQHPNELRDELREALRSGAAVVVTGAGVSQAVSGGAALGWDGLLAAGIRWCDAHVPRLPQGWAVALEQVLALGDVSSMLATAQMVTDWMEAPEGGPFREFLYHSFHDLPVVNADVLYAIAELGVPVATTNYDNLIEDALGWDRATWVDSHRLQRVFRQREHAVAHLHGHWDEPRSVILGIRSYDELLEHAGAQGLSHALATMSSLVLIGMGEGAKDPNWSALRTWMTSAFPGTMYKHFRLCRSSERDRLAEEHQGERILPVVYGDQFEDLVPFLRELAPVRQRSGPPADTPPTPPGSPADAPVKADSANGIITVDPLGHADFESITEALDAAPPGAQLRIRPGNYPEELLIDKPVTIAGLGESPGDVKIVGQHNHTIQWTAAFGSLRNISLRQSAKDAWYCVDVVAGRLDIDQCDITSSALACIAIHDGADPIIRNTEIHDGNDVGIHVLPGGQGTIVDCGIREFRLDAVRVDGGFPTLRRARIVDAGQYGIFVTDSGSGVFEGNTISHSTFANVAVTRDSDPVLRQNEIHSSSQQGVNVYDSGRGVFEENKIHRNSYSNVEVSGGSAPTFRRNEVFLGWAGGFTVANSSRGEYLHNQIYSNALAGFFIDGGSRAVLANNVIRENGAEGIVVAADSGGTLSRNEVAANAVGQIVIAAEALGNVEQEGNRISGPVVASDGQD
jgi:parallel beta-helix repeat protein